jgi:uncharacterized protein (DUF1800 family)
VVTKKTVIAANRLGLGARPGDLARIGNRPESWLMEQLPGPSRPPAEIRQLPGSAEVLVEVQDVRRERREMKRACDPDADIVNAYGTLVRRHYVNQTTARYRAAARSDTPFHERLVHFWSNHFAISADKQPLPAIAGLFENEAIRPNVSGKFVDLLLAVEQHPAMIIYLDNQRSIGPNSTLGKRANWRRSDQEFGLNENLAREILELHTLGVDGREDIHEPGAQKLLGKKYSMSGIRQGEAIMRDLAIHPSTAHFLATKLVRHFVADEPPVSLVDRLADAYLRSGGDLSVVYESLIAADETWTDTRGKYKSPHDFVISTLRAFDHVPDNPRFIVGALDLMGQTPFRPGSPEGWPDTAQQWGGADALYKRIEWSNTVARVVGSRVNPLTLGDSVLGATFQPETRKAVSRAESLSQGVALFLASPDFQRR